MEGRIRFEEIDVTRDRDAAMRYRVQATPTLVILDSSGNQVWTYVGVPEKSELERAIWEVLGP